MARPRFAPIRRVDPAEQLSVARQIIDSENARRAEERDAEEAFRRSAEAAILPQFRRDAPDPLVALDARIAVLESQYSSLAAQVGGLNGRTL